MVSFRFQVSEELWQRAEMHKRWIKSYSKKVMITQLHRGKRLHHVEIRLFELA